jgi:hypothetical protein
MAGLIQFQQFLVLGGDFFLSGELCQLAGSLRGGNGVGELTGFRIGGRERGEKSGLLVFGQFTGAFGQGTASVPERSFGVGGGGKNPGQFVQRVGKVRLEPQRLAIMGNGFLGFVLLGQGLREAAMRLREIRPFNESGGEMACGFIRFVVQQQNQAEIVLDFGIVRSEPPAASRCSSASSSLVVLQQSHAEIILCHRAVGRNAHRFSAKHQGLLFHAQVSEGFAQAGVGHEIIGGHFNGMPEEFMLFCQ